MQNVSARKLCFLFSLLCFHLSLFSFYVHFPGSRWRDGTLGADVHRAAPATTLAPGRVLADGDRGGPPAARVGTGPRTPTAPWRPSRRRAPSGTSGPGFVSRTGSYPSVRPPPRVIRGKEGGWEGRRKSLFRPSGSRTGRDAMGPG